MRALVEIVLWNAAGCAALALVVAAVSRLCRRPALTHTLWLLVLLKLVTPPLVPFSLPWPAGDEISLPAEEQHSAPAQEADAPPPVDSDFPRAEVSGPGQEEVVLPADPAPPAAAVPPPSWQWWAGLVWLAGSLLWAGWVAYHVLRFRRVVRRSRLAPGPLQDEAEELARRLGLRRCPDVWLVPGAVSPMVWALGRRPCLLFPAGLLERLDGGGRAALLAHELAHVRRRDHWVRLLELAATGLYWWHPVLWWARRELHEAEEQCCDAWAVWALGGNGRPYALALLQAITFVSQARLPLPAGASGVGQVSHLKRRLAMVMQGNTSRSLSWAGLGVVLGVGLLLLPLFPALGQDRPDPVPLPRTTPADPAAEAPKGPRDQEIDALKKRLKELEVFKERERAAQALGRVAADLNDQTQQLQLRELERAIIGKKKELQDLEAKAADLRARMKAMEGAAPRNAYTKKVPLPLPKTRESRVQDLEQRLDRLQKELEELRRELRPKSSLTPPTLEVPRLTRPADEAPPPDAPLIPLTKPAPAGPDLAPNPVPLPGRDQDPRDPAVKPPSNGGPHS